MTLLRHLATETHPHSQLDRAPRAWVLNLDAEHELEAGERYAPTDHLRGIVARESQRLIGELVGPHDVVLDDDCDPRSTQNLALQDRGLEGVAWAPTPRALARLAAAGATPPDRAPSLATLQQVNARPFASEVRAPLVRDSFEKRTALDLETALDHVAAPAAEGWLVRREFGAAGRGRRRIASGVPKAGAPLCMSHGDSHFPNAVSIVVESHQYKFSIISSLNQF